MSIENKLTYLEETKQEIKTAIENQGVAVADDATFRSYATSIAQISGTSITVDDTLSSTSENPVQNKVIYNTLLEYSPLLNDETGYSSDSGKIATVNGASLLSNGDIATTAIFTRPQYEIDVNNNSLPYRSFNFQNTTEKIYRGQGNYRSDYQYDAQYSILNREAFQNYIELNKDFFVEYFKSWKNRLDNGEEFNNYILKFAYKKSSSSSAASHYIHFLFNSSDYDGTYNFNVEDGYIQINGPVEYYYNNNHQIIGTWSLDLMFSDETNVEANSFFSYSSEKNNYKYIDGRYKILAFSDTFYTTINDDSTENFIYPSVDLYDERLSNLIYFYKITDYKYVWTNENSFYIPIEKVYKLQEALDSKQSEIDSLKTNIDDLILRIEALEAYHPAEATPMMFTTLRNASRSYVAQNYNAETASFISTNDGETEQAYPNTVTIDGDTWKTSGTASTIGKVTTPTTLFFVVPDNVESEDFSTTLFTCEHMDSGETIGANLVCESGVLKVKNYTYQGMEQLTTYALSGSALYVFTIDASGNTNFYQVDWTFRNLITPGDEGIEMSSLTFSNSLNSTIPVPFKLYMTVPEQVEDSNILSFWDELVEKGLCISYQ